MEQHSKRGHDVAAAVYECDQTLLSAWRCQAGLDEEVSGG